jgi:rsbT co-antagonist protein RsbR
MDVSVPLASFEEQPVTTSAEFLEAAHRRTIRTIALVLFVSSTISALPTAVGLALNPSPSGVVNLVNGLIIIAGSGLAVWAKRRPLWQMVVPLAVAIMLVELSTALFLPEVKVVVAPFLAVVVLLVSLGNNRRLTIATMIICALLAVVTVGLQLPSLAISALGPSAVPVQMVVVGALVVVIWAVSDRFTVTQNTALAMAEQRAVEAEAAQAQAQAARAEIEQRVLEQQRLLELVQTLELPVLSVDSGVLVVPLVGNLDSRRMNALRNEVLHMVSRQRAQTVILDITGITVIDTLVAKALTETAQAIRLLGARTLVSGMRPSVAQTLVCLDTGLQDLYSVANLGAALDVARVHSTDIKR